MERRREGSSSRGNAIFKNGPWTSFLPLLLSLFPPTASSNASIFGLTDFYCIWWFFPLRSPLLAIYLLYMNEVVTWVILCCAEHVFLWIACHWFWHIFRHSLLSNGLDLHSIELFFDISIAAMSFMSYEWSEMQCHVILRMTLRLPVNTTY